MPMKKLKLAANFTLNKSNPELGKLILTQKTLHFLGEERHHSVRGTMT